MSCCETPPKNCCSNRTHLSGRLKSLGVGRPTRCQRNRTIPLPLSSTTISERSSFSKLIIEAKANIPKTERSFQKATIFKKNLGYFQLYNDKDHPNRFNKKTGFTVFWVTSGKEQKVANIAKSIRAATGDQLAYAFLTTCDDHIRASNNIHKVPWMAASGEEMKFEI